VPFDAEAVDSLEPEQRPRPRRFTVRRWEQDRLELTIDFVAHGDSGFAGAWAQRAQVGDRLQFVGPGGNFRPPAAADWHLFIGDESALPAIAAGLESLDATAIARVFLVVDDVVNEFDLAADTGLAPGVDVEINWLHRSEVGDPEHVLVAAVEAAQLPSGTCGVFVHGEAGEVRSVRRHLIADRGVDPAAASISAYWRRDFNDEQWRQVKRQWLIEQAADT